MSRLYGRLALISSMVVALAGTASVHAQTGAEAIILNDRTVEIELSGSIGEVDRRTQSLLAELGFELVAGSLDIGRDQRRFQFSDGHRLVAVELREVARRTTAVRLEAQRLSQTRILMFEWDTRFARSLAEMLS